MFGKTLLFILLSQMDIYSANPFPDFYDDYSEEDLGPAPGLCDISARLGYWGRQMVLILNCTKVAMEDTYYVFIPIFCLICKAWNTSILLKKFKNNCINMKY